MPVCVCVCGRKSGRDEENSPLCIVAPEVSCLCKFMLEESEREHGETVEFTDAWFFLCTIVLSGPSRS